MGTTQSTPPQEIQKLDHIKFYLQGAEHTVSTNEITPTTSLNDYIRKILKMTGTKGMCYEGGCGSCLVVLERFDPKTKKKIVIAVNSCLIPVLACSGWKIFTVEGIGNPLAGYHPVQKVLAEFNGTQCGFCSPGMVMNMYALKESGNVTMEKIENSFGGNICRCTGYRPILAAFKSMASDASSDLLGTYPDMEDLKLCKKECKTKCLQECADMLLVEQAKIPYYHEIGSAKWIKVYTLQEILSTLLYYSHYRYKLVAGNTARGVYASYKDPVDVYIDINFVEELRSYILQPNRLIIGASTTLTDAITLFETIGTSNPQFSYLKQLAKHIDLVANVPVRNVGTLAGNLMIKHDHHDFPSDIFLLMETVGAKFSIINAHHEVVLLSPREFINCNMYQRVFHYINLPSLPSNVKFQSYKIMPRAQNVHALVNAGFLYTFKGKNLSNANIVFGNIDPNFIHPLQTETYLKGKDLFDNVTLKNAYALLANELTPDTRPPEPSPKFRKELAIALFYKSVLAIAPENKISDRIKSGATIMERPISNGVQDFETSESLYPLTQAIPKIEAQAQTSGQAQYIFDMGDLPHQLWGALVLAKAPPNSIIKKVDASEALKINGITAYFDKSDIPGKNSFQMVTVISLADEELFCKGRVLYYEQPIGVLVGTNEDLVNKTVDLVQVEYETSNVTPLLSVRQVLQSDEKNRILDIKTVPATRKGNDIKHIVKGQFDIQHQYHFHMETQSCSVVPTEDGLTIYPATQYMDLIQNVVARILNIQRNKLNIVVRRCGGAFGAKISRSGLVAGAAALAAWKLKKPVKIHMTLPANMAVFGRRWPLSTDYEVGLNDAGVIQYLNCTLYTDVGAIYSEEPIVQLQSLFRDNYINDTFTMRLCKAVTDTATNTWTRAPGSAEGLAAIEAIMDHVSYALNIDPLELRLSNISTDSSIIKYITDIKTWADIDARKKDITNFNKLNRWKKKGISVVPMTYRFEVGPAPLSVMVSVFWDDGSVQVQHGGIEMGQGINTKVAQVCAYKLGIPLEKVAVIPSNNFVGANNVVSGGSFTSESVCYAVIQACDELLEGLKPYKKPTWEETVQTAYFNSARLFSNGYFTSKSPNISSYLIYGVCACEVLLDVLTGQHIVSRVDLIEDVGQAMSPLVDIGQIEGAFIMGLGYYTTEKIVFNYEGKVLTNNTWTYHPPGAKDIPVDFRVKIPKKNPNPLGVLRSKAVGEPPLCLSFAVPLAIRNAVASARVDSNSSASKWYPFTGVTDVENVFLNLLNKSDQYVL